MPAAARRTHIYTSAHRTPPQHHNTHHIFMQSNGIFARPHNCDCYLDSSLPLSLSLSLFASLPLSALVRVVRDGDARVVVVLVHRSNAFAADTHCVCVKMFSSIRQAVDCAICSHFVYVQILCVRLRCRRCPLSRQTISFHYFLFILHRFAFEDPKRVTFPLAIYANAHQNCLFLQRYVVFSLSLSRERVRAHTLSLSPTLTSSVHRSCLVRCG